MNTLLSDAGGLFFTFALLVLNSWFLLWEKLRTRVDFYENEAKSTVSQACANVMDVSAKAKEESDKLLRSVNAWFSCLRKSSLLLIQLTVVACLLILFLGWEGKATFLLLLPLSSYSFLSWVWFRKFVRKSNQLRASYPEPSRSDLERTTDPSGSSSASYNEEACPLHSELIKMSKNLGSSSRNDDVRN